MLNSTYIVFAQDNTTYSKPSVTIDYYTFMWRSHPDVKVIQSSDKTLVFELDGNLIEFHEITNDKNIQEVLLVENSNEFTIRKELLNDKLFLNNNEITYYKVDRPQMPKSNFTTNDTWSAPFGHEYYRVSFGQEILYELTVVTLTTLIISQIHVLIGIATGIATNMYAKRNDPNYRYLAGTYIEYYMQLETSNYYYYRKVWNCYADSSYSDFITQYIQVVY